MDRLQFETGSTPFEIRNFRFWVNNVGDLGVCFFRSKMSTIYGTHLHTFAVEEVGQTSLVYKKKIVCFLTSASS